MYLKFEGDYFTYLTKYQAMVAQLRTLDGINSNKDLAIQFLEKLPRTLSTVTHPLKTEVDAATVDNKRVWTKAFNDVVSYLIDAGHYNPSRKFDASKYQNKAKAYVAKSEDSEKKSFSKSKAERRCYGCNEKGHYKYECPERKEKDTESKKENTKPEASKKKKKGKLKMMVLGIKKNMISKSVANTTSAHFESCFLLDSGATNHCCGEVSMFTKLKKVEAEQLLTANGVITYDQVGDVEVILDNGREVIMENVLYWPGAPSLISIAALSERNMQVLFKKNVARIQDSEEDILYEAVKENDVYLVKYKVKKVAVAKTICLSVAGWHNRLNHCGIEKFKLTVGDLFPSKDIEKFYEEVCVGCVKGKAKRAPIFVKNKVETEYQPLELLVADCVGPYNQSINKKRGALIVGDAASGFIWFLPFYRKSEVPSLLKSLLKRLEVIFPGQVRCLQTDNGGEFCNKVLESFLKKVGIQHRKSIAYEHEMQGRAENNNRIILEGIRANLYGAQLSKGYWTYAGHAAVYVFNRLKRSKDKRSPWEFLYDKKFNLKSLRTFGMLGFNHISREKRKKLEPTSVRVRLLGYASDSKGYIVRNIETSRIFNSRSFFCDEDTFISKVKPEPYLLSATGEYIMVSEDSALVEVKEIEVLEDYEAGIKDGNFEEITIPVNTNLVPEVIERENYESVQVQSVEENINENITTVEEELSEEESSNNDSSYEAEEPEKNFCDINEENIIEGSRTRSQANILGKLRRVLLKRKLALTVKKKRSNGSKGFRSYKDAVASNPSWEDAYLKEIGKLEKQGEMKVIKREKWMNCIPFIEVLTEKVNNISGENTLKVRLAVRGDLQKDIPDNVYSPAAGTTEMRTFLLIMKLLKAFVVQGDCPAAYLNGRLEELVYLFLPEGHPQKDEKDTFVYACPSSIYGLAVAGRVWYYTFCKEVKEFGFIPLRRAPTIFVLRRNGESAYLELYVDDFVLGSTSESLLEECEDFLEEKFKVKCTDNLKKFVGIELFNKKNKLYLHQQTMIEKLGLKYRVQRGFTTPLVPNMKWQDKSIVLEEQRNLQVLFGELNYIAGLTRPDVSYSVNRIARKLHEPTKEVFRSAKRILSYLVATSDYCLTNKYWNRDWQLEVFADSSFADIPKDKFKSTGGYCIYLNKSLVSWKSRKSKYVCTSTAEAEYVALFEAAKQGL